MIEFGKEDVYFNEADSLDIPSLADIKKNMTLFLPFILSFLLLMEHLFLLSGQDADFLWSGGLAMFFSAATVATYCQPNFHRRFLANAPIVSVGIGLVMFWNLPLF